MKNIIIVDDSETARMFVQRCLEAIGLFEANFFEAANGSEALDHISKEDPDLIVTDLTMPVMDGETLLKKIKSDTAYKDIPVLIITSAGNKAREGELLNQGALAVLAKPFSPKNLYALLQPLISQ